MMDLKKLDELASVVERCIKVYECGCRPDGIGMNKECAPLLRNLVNELFRRAMADVQYPSIVAPAPANLVLTDPLSQLKYSESAIQDEVVQEIFAEILYNNARGGENPAWHQEGMQSVWAVADRNIKKDYLDIAKAVMAKLNVSIKPGVVSSSNEEHLAQVELARRIFEAANRKHNHPRQWSNADNMQRECAMEAARALRAAYTMSLKVDNTPGAPANVRAN
jgi:hypothetical protein